MNKYLYTFLSFFLFSVHVFAQSDSIKTLSTQEISQPKKWYENLSIRGYTQIRYNRLLETNENLGCEQCDKYWGKDGGFFMRRMRVIIFGQISKN